MDSSATERTRRLIGDDGVRKLEAAGVLLFGLGGVGSWCAEALVRAGLGRIGLVDRDAVSPSNLNRQLCALVSTVGLRKTEVVRKRLLDVNPALQVEVFDISYGAETAEKVPLAGWDVVVDAIDLVSAKVLLFERARAAGVALVSAMGGGNKTDASRFRVADLAETFKCPLAAAMRKKLRRAGIEHGAVVFSDETPRRPAVPESERGQRHAIPGTLPTVVGVEGLLLAQAAMDEILRRP